MIIKRKLYAELKAQPFVYVDPEQEKRSAQERKGEALGTAILGTGATLATIKPAGKIAKNISLGKESEKAVQNYKAGVRKLMEERTKADRTAADKLAGYKEAVGKKWFGKDKAIKEAEEAYEKSVAGNKSAYQAAVKKLRKEVVSGKNKAIQKAGRNAKLGVLAGGLALTGLAASSKLRNKDNQ